MLDYIIYATLTASSYETFSRIEVVQDCVLWHAFVSELPYLRILL
jgi:hypothetical protein